MTITKKRIRVNRKKAVKIARDVLEQLRIKRLIAAAGTYCEVKTEQKDEDIWDYQNKSFQEIYNTRQNVKCEVCAIGSLFVSLVHLENTETLEDVDSPKFEALFERLSDVFHPRDLLLMEFVFEEGHCGELAESTYDRDENDDVLHGTYRFTRQELEKAKKYGEKQRDDHERLRVIMLNVIRNKGRFVLPQRIRG